MFCVLSLVQSPSGPLPLNKGLPVLGQNQLGDLDIGGVDWDLNQSPLLGLSLNLLYVETPPSSVDVLDLA